MPNRILTIAVLVFNLFFALSITAAESEKLLYRGQLLPEALAQLQRQGLRLIYSKNIVKPWMRVHEQPEPGSLDAALLQILKPHRLTAELGAADTWVIVVDEDIKKNTLGALRGRVLVNHTNNPVEQARLIAPAINANFYTLADGTFLASNLPAGRQSLRISAPGFKEREITARVRANTTTQIEVTLEPEAQPVDELKIIASRHEMYSTANNGGQFLTRQDVDRSPHIADDLSRAVSRLPGLAGGDTFARLNLRGGLPNEIRVDFDGLELYDPFHVKDLGGLLSVVDTNIIDGLDLISGGYTADFGDVMSGIINIDSLIPADDKEFEVGVTFVNLFGRAQGSFAEGKGSWLLSARRGYLDFLFDIVEEDDEDFNPRYSDLLAKASYDVGEKTTLGVNVLIAEDSLFFTENDEAFPEENRGDSSSRYVWFTLDNDWSESLDSSTVFSFESHDQERTTIDFDGTFKQATLFDARDSDEFGLKTDWRWLLADRHMLKWGLEFSQQKATYNYDLAGFHTGVLGGPEQFILDREANLSVDGDEYAAHVAYRYQPLEPLTVEIGMRWDKQTYTDLDDNDQVSPRINALYNVSNRTKLRLAWGHFHQSQRIQELQVADGVNNFFPAQRAEHRVIGFSHSFKNGLSLRSDFYQKRYTKVLPYFENFLDPSNLVPEATPDRIRITPEESEARGFEVLLRHDPDRVFDWWTSYAYSIATDKIDGSNVLRSWDQKHALNFGLNWHWNNWNVNLAGGMHTGRPITPILVDTQPAPGGGFLGFAELGERNADRLDFFQRYDIRVSREVKLRNSKLNYFFEIYNIFDAENPCCVEGFDFGFDNASSSFFSIANQDNGMPRLPSFGVSWSF